MRDTAENKRLERMKLRVERLKSWTTISAIIASLITAMSAYFKKEEDQGAKDVYKELSGAVEKISEEQVKLHSDIAAIRGYLAGKAQTPTPAIVKFLEVPTQQHRTRQTEEPKTKAIIEEEPDFEVPTLKPAPNRYEAPPVEEVTK